MKHFVAFLFKGDKYCPFKIYRLMVVQLEKREALKAEDEKKRKALKRRTLKDQVSKYKFLQLVLHTNV